MANGDYYYHVIARLATEIGSGARERRCGRTGINGHRPRRHAEVPVLVALTKGRGTNPGDTSPRAGTRLPPAALNEGRVFNPGDTI